MAFISDELEPVTHSTEIATKQLHEHKQRLRVINSVIVREGRMVGQEIARLQASFWTAIGGNRQRLRRLKERRMELHNLGQYHKRTLANVGGTLRKLRTKRADTIALQGRALSASHHNPVQIHMKSLATGLERLRHPQLSAKEQKVQPDRILSAPFVRQPAAGEHSDDSDRTYTIPAFE